MKNAITQRGGDHDAGEHGAQKQGPTDTQQNQAATVAEKLESLSHLAKEAFERSFGGHDVGVQFRGAGHDVASAAHREIAEEGDPVRREIDEQNAAQADVVIDEPDNRAGNQPASLDAGQQKGVGIDEFFPRSQLLDEGGDGRPEHPETRRHQHVHQVEFPDFHFAGIGQQGHDHDDQGARGIEDHDQAAAIFAVDEDAGEGEHQHGGDRLQNGEGAESGCGVRGLQNVPGDGGRVHAAAQHGDQIGAEDETQRPLLQNGTHTLLYTKNVPVECPSRV